jgi:uncharacterized protein (DUF1015 family)
MPRMSAARTSGASPGSSGLGPGLVLAPFRGLRFAPDRVPDLGAVTSPPYDVVGPEGVTSLEQADPHNVVRIILPRADPDDPESRYRRAAATLAAWRAEGVLVADDQPGLYVYEQVTGTGGSQAVSRGLVGALGLRQAEAAVVLPHEDVMPGPVEDRLRLMRATAANPEPILLTYDGGGPASDLVDRTAAVPPLLGTVTADGARHRLWQVTDPDDLAAVAADLEPRRALIADGHHRYATYLRLQAEQRAAGHGPGPWDYGLALLVDSARHPLRVAAIHRVAPGIPPDKAVELAAGHFRVEALDGGPSRAVGALVDLPAGEPAFAVTDGERCWLLSDPDPAAVDRLVPDDRPRTWRRLDATVLHLVLLDQVWRVPDRYPDLQYHHDLATAVRTAGQTGGTAVLLRPVPERLVRDLAAAGVRLPRKSTSFGPKPRNGLVLRTLDET